MISILPHATETLVLPMSGAEVVSRLKLTTTGKTLYQNRLHDPSLFFTGHIRENRFRISLKISRPNSFIPLVTGKVDTTSSGSLIFFTYKLFPSTRLYLSFWTMFTLMAAIFLGYQYKNYVLSIMLLAVTGIILWVAWANFNMQLKLTRKAFEEVLR